MFSIPVYFCEPVCLLLEFSIHYYEYHSSNTVLIDKLYTQSGTVFRLPWELNLLLSCLGSRHCTHAYTETVDPACGPTFSQCGACRVLYGRGQLGSILEKKRLPPSFTHLAVLFIYYCHFQILPTTGFIIHVYKTWYTKCTWLRLLAHNLREEK